MSARPIADRLGALDAFRGLLALGVASYHLSVWFGVFPSGSALNMAMAKVGNFGVSAFFMLSGFLIFRLQTWEDLRREGLGRFYVKRYLRLAPIFYLAVALNVCLALGMGPQASPRMLLENVTLVFGAIHPNHALVIGGWYVGLVVLLYAAFPGLVWLRDRWGFGFLVPATLGLWAWSLPTTLEHAMVAPLSERFHLYVQPANQLFLFLLGGLGAWCHARWPRRLKPLPFFVGVLGLSGCFLMPRPHFSDHLVAMTGWLRYGYLLLVFGLLLLFAFKDTAPSAAPRAWSRPWVLLGVWSYSSYLLHPFFFYLLRNHLSGWPGFLAALVLSFGTAALTERWIERPIADWTKRLYNRA